MRILITGVGGFVGGHLFRHLQQTTPEAEIHGTTLAGVPPPALASLVCHEIELKDEAAVNHLIEQVRPDQIYHLAAQASPRLSFDHPWDTLENNIRSQLNVTQACVNLDITPRILIISSGEIYGAVRAEQPAVTEDTPLRPASPYGVSKITQDMLGLQYHLKYGLPIMRVRPFNHAGPRQREGFVAVDYAIKIARIEAGQQEPFIEIRSPSAQRDFTDVRDVVQAYRLVMEQGIPGEVYNIASGQTYSIQQLVRILIGYSRIPIKDITSESAFTEGDVSVIKGDATRLRRAMGWQPNIPFEQTLLDVLNDCRQRVQRSG